MYFPPRTALQAFWTALRCLLLADPRMAGVALPAALDEPADCHAQWLQSDLLLSQACGYPLVTQLAGKVQLVGTFCYDATGVQGMHCRSQMICRASDTRHALQDFAGGTLAFNDTISQSGFNALRALVATTTTQRPFFGRSLQTGAHLRSIEAVRTGQADMAALDAVSWALWQSSNPAQAAELRVFGQTEGYPGLPLITSLHTASEVLAALRQCLHTLATQSAFAQVRAPLLISGFEASSMANYQRCLDMQEQALGLGVRTL
jgi:ABC-type phosphate/phosphonate transport system substrate-binding protein